MSPTSRAGVLNAIAAYTMWGFAPLYFKILQSVPSSEILVHRIIWSLALLFLLLLVMNKKAELRQLLRQPEKLKVLLVSGILLGINWLLFIYAINSNQILEASLGYYINPMFSVLLGYLALGERFHKWQKIAIGIAVIGVINQIIAVGNLPIIALSLAGTFGIYGLMRKKVAVESLTGLTVETVLLLPFAIIYWMFFASSEYSNMFENAALDNFWLIMAGVVTTAPLLCFTAAAKRLKLSTVGLFQYIGPTLMFAVAIFVYNEPLETSRIVTFSLIWTALAIFSWDSIRQARKQAKSGPE